MDSKKRLDIIRSSNDGFFIGEQDMLQRGGGEVLGTRQIGFAEFKVFNYSVHHNIMGDVLGIHK